MTIERAIAADLGARELRLEHTMGSGNGDPSLDACDEMDSPVRNNPPSLLDAAGALLEARENQMVTHVEWERLAHALATQG